MGPCEEILVSKVLNGKEVSSRCFPKGKNMVLLAEAMQAKEKCTKSPNWDFKTTLKSRAAILNAAPHLAEEQSAALSLGKSPRKLLKMHDRE